MAADEHLPVSLLTGFLGSGKTTLLGRALTHPALGRVAVIINEFGDVGLDHDLLEASSEDMVMLGNGCLCCSIHGSLVDTMRDLLTRRDAGRVAFDRVIIETSGLADPVPVLRMIESDAIIAARYRIETVIATVDAVNGANALDKHAEAVRQAAVADAILVTKSDIAPSSATTALTQRLAQLNPTADIRTVVQGNIAPDAIFFRGLSVNEARHNLPVCEHAHDHAHDSRIRTFTLTFEAPVDPVTLQRLMAAIEQLKGPSLLRVKGIVHPQDGSGPLVIHAVQDVVHPLTRLARPIEAGPSRVVFITWDVPRERLDQLMRQLAE